jgi:hypothetical protein
MAKINWNKVKNHLNKPVICTFWDHCSNDKLVLCNAIGYLAEIDDDFIMIVSWDTPDLEPSDRLKNMEFYGLIKSAIIDILPLRESKVWG